MVEHIKHIYIYEEYELYGRSTSRNFRQVRMEGRRQVEREMMFLTKLAEWKKRGYAVKSASVRFVVAWKPKGAPKDESETAVLLPDVVLACNL